jgi:hypothetical protein
MGKRSYWFWDHFVGDAGFFCNGYGFFKSSLMKCIWKDTDGQKRLPVEPSAYQKLRLGWIRSDVGAIDTRVVWGPDEDTPIQLSASENKPSSSLPRLVAVPIDADNWLAIEYRAGAASYYDKDALPNDAIVVYHVSKRGPWCDPAVVGCDDAQRVAVLTANQSWSGSDVSLRVDANTLSRLYITRKKAPATLGSLSLETRTGGGGGILDRILTATGENLTSGAALRLIGNQSFAIDGLTRSSAYVSSTTMRGTSASRRNANRGRLGECHAAADLRNHEQLAAAPERRRCADL